MTVAYDQGGIVVHHGDCLDVLRSLPVCSVDAVCTDPPYALGFMGQAWDTHTPGGFQHWCELWAAECLRILKPGGHLLAFGGTRTYHRLAAGIEDAGFEIRDSLHWIYGSGFPKSLDVSKAIDKAAGAEREVTRIGVRHSTSEFDSVGSSERERRDTPATDAARTWQGWGTALKPAHEPIVVARKPLAGTVAANVQQYGTGALNIDGCRVAVDANDPNIIHKESRGGTSRSIGGGNAYQGGTVGRGPTLQHPQGRWPANVLLDGEAAQMLDGQSGPVRSGGHRNVSEGVSANQNVYGNFAGCKAIPGVNTYSDSGGASRFFPVFRYEAKADTAERPLVVDGVRHPTVKPLALMAWLVRLVTPPGGTVLEPFAGSGTTVEACIEERARCVAIERDGSYLPLILQRIHRHRDPGAYLASRGETAGTLFDEAAS